MQVCIWIKKKKEQQFDKYFYRRKLQLGVRLTLKTARWGQQSAELAESGSPVRRERWATEEMWKVPSPLAGQADQLAQAGVLLLD